jgi:hypothetical protein
MSISPLSVTASHSYATGSDSRQSFRDLGRALKSGDLAGAQKAYAALTKELSQSSSSAPNSISSQLSDPNSALGKDLAAIGKDLQNGNLSGAQQDFAKLRQDTRTHFQSQTPTTQGHPHGHHHHHADAASETSDGSSTTTTPDAASPSTGSVSGSTVNVVA